MKPFVNDYKILLIETRKNDLTLHNMNNKDLFHLLNIIFDKTLSRNETKQKAIQYSEKHNTNKSVVMTVAGTTNTKLDYNALKKGGATMCTLFEEIAKENQAIGEAKGEAQGRAIGIIETGLEFGLSEEDILTRLQKKLNISLQAAQEYFKTFAK